MPELAKPDLEHLVTELLIALRPKCCRLIPCPDLCAPTFQLNTSALGQIIYIVPDSISQEEAAKQIERGQLLATKNNFHIVSDGRPGQVLHLGVSTDWRTSIRCLLNRLLGNDQWEMVYAEQFEGQPGGPAKLGLLRASQEEEEEEEGGGRREDGRQREVWMAPVNRRIVAGCVKKVKKKVIRRVVRKGAGTGGGGGGGGKEEESPINGQEKANGVAVVDNGQNEGQQGERQKAEPAAALQNGIGGLHGPSSPKLLNGKGEGIVGRIANIFNGMNGNNNARTARGRSQSFEEPAENGPKGPKTEGKLRRADSEGSSSGKELTPEKMVAKKGAGGGGGGESIRINGAGPGGGYVRIPVVSNGSTPSPERQQQNGGGQNGPMPKVEEEEEKRKAEPDASRQNGKTNGPLCPPSPPQKPLSLCVATNRPTPRMDSSSSPRDSPPSPISPPSASVGSDSPNSFHSASGDSPLVGLATRRWRREDAPSPSTSLIQNVLVPPRRNGGGAGGAGPSTGGVIPSRLGPPLGSLLSPISSCGSVEGQQDLLFENGEGHEEEGEEEEESTLMLLNRERTSAGRSTLGGEDADELSCSLAMDLSLASISQKGPSLVEQSTAGRGGTSTTPGGRQEATTRLGTITRRVQSPSPPKQAVSMSPAAPHMVRGMLGHFRMPVPVLQHIISLFSYKKMGEMRRVHPHWDELCGQLLNAAHSQLLHSAQRLLTDCQRRMHKGEPGMAQPVQLLTRFHVHVLNPVDGMRAFMDEGVLCFPYGALLDHAYAMLDRIERMIANSATDSNEAREREYDDANIQMDQLGDMARRASLHYRQWVEPEAEKRMGELYRASAQQRLQRLDSFMVESSVTRVERGAEKARSELGWEMEQMRQQNQQLKKENRELKQMCQRLDQRVDVLERKFKTMARLLQ